MKTDSIENLKHDFPIFQHHPELIYLDNAATHHKPQFVIDAISSFYETSYASVHRGLYPLSEQATELFEEVRKEVALFINASPNEIIFTKGTTEGINMIASSWALSHLKKGDEILLTEVEHHANLIPWQMVAEKTGALLRFIPLNKETLLLDFNLNFISSKTRLVAVTHNSNVLGDVWNGQLEKLISYAHEKGAYVLLDAAQTFPHQSLDMKKIGCDFLAFSGHKTVGPTGVGCLYIAESLHEQVEPFLRGGSMVYSVDYEKASWAKTPWKYEAGTPATSSVIGLGAGIQYLKHNINFNDLERHEAGLCSQLIDSLQPLKEVSLYTNISQAKQRGHLVSFAVRGIHAHDIAAFLGTQNIAVRAGHHCAQPLANLLGEGSLIRVSFAMYNTKHDVDIFVEKLIQALSFFKRYGL